MVVKQTIEEILLQLPDSFSRVPSEVADGCGVWGIAAQGYAGRQLRFSKGRTGFPSTTEILEGDAVGAPMPLLNARSHVVRALIERYVRWRTRQFEPST